MGRLENQVALVTGAASGIGYACALRFAQEGAVVVGFDRHECPEWKAVADAAPQNSYVVGDVTDEATVEALVRDAVDQFGSLDVSVNAAGITGGGPVHLLSLEDWNRVMNVNATGTFLVGKHAAAVMMNQPSGGSIVNVASIEGVEGTEGGSCYSASKGAVVILTKNMAIDYGRRGVRVNAVCPGFIDTPWFGKGLGEDAAARVRANAAASTPLQAASGPDDIAAATIFLASPASRHVAGESLLGDAGSHLGYAARVAR